MDSSDRLHVLRGPRVRIPRSLASATIAAVVATAAAGCGNGSGSASSAVAAGPSSSTAVTPSNSSAALTHVVVASPTPPHPDDAPIFWANNTGLWKKHGLDVSFSTLTPAAGVAALVSGSIDIFVDGTGSLKAAVDTGKVVVTGTYSEPVLDLFVNPSVVKNAGPITSISQLSELKGVTFAGSSPGSLVDVALKALLAKAGLTPGKDVNLAYLGAGGLAALKKGEVGASVFAAGQIPQAKAAGLKDVASLNQLTGGQGIMALVGVNKAFLQAHPEAVKAFATTFRDAIAQINANPTQAVSYISNAISASVQQTTEAWKLQAPYVFLKPVPPSEINTDLAHLSATDPAAKNANLSQIVDNAAMN